MEVTQFTYFQQAGGKVRAAACCRPFAHALRAPRACLQLGCHAAQSCCAMRPKHQPAAPARPPAQPVSSRRGVFMQPPANIRTGACSLFPALARLPGPPEARACLFEGPLSTAACLSAAHPPAHPPVLPPSPSGAGGAQRGDHVRAGAHPHGAAGRQGRGGLGQSYCRLEC